MADWSRDNPHSIRGVRDMKEREDALRDRMRKTPLGACVLCGDARFTGNNRGEQPKCINVRDCQRRQRMRIR